MSQRTFAVPYRKSSDGLTKMAFIKKHRKRATNEHGMGTNVPDFSQASSADASVYLPTQSEIPSDFDIAFDFTEEQDHNTAIIEKPTTEEPAKNTNHTEKKNAEISTGCKTTTATTKSSVAANSSNKRPKEHQGTFPRSKRRDLLNLNAIPRYNMPSVGQPDDISDRDSIYKFELSPESLRRQMKRTNQRQATVFLVIIISMICHDHDSFRKFIYLSVYCSIQLNLYRAIV